MRYFFLIFQIITGFDLGFTEHKSKFKRYVWKSFLVLCASNFIIIFLLLLFNAKIPMKTFSFWVSFYLVHYIQIFFCFLFMRPDKTFCHLHHDLESIDTVLRVRGDSYNVEMKLLIAVGVMVLINSIQFCFFCFTYDTVGCSQHLLLSIFINASITIPEIIEVVCASIFYAFYCRIKTMKLILSTDRVYYTNMRQIYKSVADLIETYKSEFDLLVR